MLKSSHFDYYLPKELIANEPSKNRPGARLLVFCRQTGSISHHFFWQLPAILKKTGKKYLIIYNDSRVIPARLYGQKQSGGKVEILLSKLHCQQQHSQTWECLTKPALKASSTIIFPPQNLTAQVLTPNSGYTCLIDFPLNKTAFAKFLTHSGHTPIPPYIKTTLSEHKLRQVYQTVYAKNQGSVAAPTAGLHFNDSLIKQLKSDGHTLLPVTLHVGLGTFLAVTSPTLAEHHMHSEYFSVSTQTLTALNKAKTQQQPILAIGTTSTRVLESLSTTEIAKQKPLSRETTIFLYPEAKFHHTNCLITNFHLPKSTLLMLVAAFTSHPNCQEKFTTWNNSQLAQAYQAAINQQYRFFSFGDAMLIL